MSNARMTHYQNLLLNPPWVRFLPSAALNPSTLLPDPDLEAPLHDCTGILSQVHGLRKDLMMRHSQMLRLPGSQTAAASYEMGEGTWGRQW
jgi:hypothetical protein